MNSDNIDSRDPEGSLSEAREEAVLSLWAEKGLFYSWTWDTGQDKFILPSLWLERLGYSPDSKSQNLKGFLSLMHSLDLPWVEDLLRRYLLDEKESLFVKCRVIGIEGNTKWIEIHGEVQNSPSGKGTRITGILQDITERQLTEERLKANEENFRVFFDTMDDLIFIGGPSGKIIHTNQAVQDSLDFSTEDLVHYHILDLFPKDQREEAEEHFNLIFQGQQNLCPLPLVRKDGTLLQAETLVWFGIWDGKDCIFANSRNVSSRWEAQQRFEKLFHNNPALMWLASADDWSVEQVNLAFISTLQYSEDEVRDENLDLFLDHQEKETIDRLLHQGQKINPTELGLRRKDGNPVYGLFSGEMIQSGDKNLILAVFVDITQRKEAEKALQRERELFSQGPVLMLILKSSESFPIDFISRNANTILGYPIEELMNKKSRFTYLLHPDDLQSFLSEWEQILYARNESFDQSLRLRTKNGSYKWFYCLFHLEWGIMDLPETLTGYIFDQTELKNAESTLARERQRLRDNLEETARMNRLMMGREERILEMKREVNSLIKELGREIRYRSVEDGDIGLL